jgi:hypothetical protein
MPIDNALTPEGQNALGAAFGYYPQLRRNRTVQDPQAALDMPVQFLRGRVASTLGAPSDVLNALRSPMPMEAFGDVDYGQQTQVPYGTQDLLQRLPLAPQGPAQQAAANIGSVVPLTPMEALQAARLARQAALVGKNLPVGLSIKAEGGMDFLKPSAAPQEQALRLAQQRASLPPSQGGLGLPANNTPQQRAAAMKFEERGFHETEGANIENGLSNFDVKRVGAAASDEQTPYAMFIKPHPAGLGIARNNPAQMPLMVKSNLTDENILKAFADRGELQQYLDQFPEIKKSTNAVRELDQKMAKHMEELSNKADELYAQGKIEEADRIYNSMGFDSPMMKEFDARTGELAAKAKQQITDLFNSQGVGTVGLTNDAGAFGRKTITEMVLNPNENVRSRFAAFDPWRKTAATAAAFGVAAPDLLAAESQDDINQMRKLKANKK